MRQDHISGINISNYSIVPFTITSLLSESSGQLITTLCKPLQHRVSFSNDSMLYIYDRYYEFSPINIFTVKINRNESRECFRFFGKNTTAFYRWDHKPSFQFIEDFLYEKK